MATYPIKMLKDEEGKPFVPLINIDAIKELGGDSLMETIEGKLEVTNIIAGRQIDLDVDGNNITINNSSEGTKLINNLDATTSGTGALDAAQGKVLKDSIPEVINNLTTIDSKKALSAHQGYVLAGRSVPVGGSTGQVLMKSANDDYSLTWGDVVDSNAITEQLNNYVLKPDVLWSNPKPTEDFYKQTITVPNLSSYSYIEIIFYNWVDGQFGYESVKAPVGSGNVVNLSFVINLYLDDDTVSTCHFGSRLGTMNTSANTIDWGAQHGCVVFVNDKYPSSSDSQAWGVPVKILGYKL